MGEWNITDPTFSMDVCVRMCVALEFSIGSLKVQKLHIMNKTSLYRFMTHIYGGIFSKGRKDANRLQSYLFYYCL